MVKLPAGFDGTIETKASEFRAVIIAGTVYYNSEGLNSPQVLSAGSFVESTGSVIHQIKNKADTAATIYIRTNSRYQVN